MQHYCIGWQREPGVAAYRWEFAEQGWAFDVVVNVQLNTNDIGVMSRTASAGGGIAIGLEETRAANELVPLLEAYLPEFAGFYLYFPSRKNLAPKLRALIDHMKM